MSPNDADWMANSVDPDQTALGAVWSGSALFAQAYLSKNLRSLRYYQAHQCQTNGQQTVFALPTHKSLEVHKGFDQKSDI